MNPVKTKAEELLAFVKEITKNENLFEENDLVHWISNSDELKDYYQVTDEEIVNVLNCNNKDSDDDDNDDKDLDNSKKIKFDDGLCLGEQYLKILEQQNCISEQELILIYNL